MGETHSFGGDKRLRPRYRWGALLVLVLVFVFVDGPLWEHPFDVDVAAWMTYAPIPLLVLLLLYLDRKLGWTSWLLNTVELTLVKFGTTYLIALCFWVAYGPPARAESQAAPQPRAAHEPASLPAPTPWPDTQRGDLAVTVVDARAQPVAGAAVWIAEGLDEMVFAPPGDAITLSLGADGWSQSAVVVHEHQSLYLRAADGKLHSIRLGDGDATLVVPLLASGSMHRVTFPAGSRVDSRCALHDHGSATLRVLHHGYHGISDAAGRVALRGVPALPVSVAAALGAQQQIARTDVAAQREGALSLMLR